MKRVLIIGASSLIGSNLAVGLREKNIVYGTYSKTRPNLNRIPLIKLTLQPETPMEDLVHRLVPDAIIYCVSQSDFLACEADPETTSFLHEAAAARLCGVANHYGSKFIYLSSSKVFSGKQGRYTEDHEPDPICVYGGTKVHAEKTLSRIGNASILRLGTVFGLGARGVEENAMLHRILSGIWNRKREFQLVSDEYRTFTCVSEVTKVIELLMEIPRSQGIFHLGNSERNSYFSFATKLAKKLALPADHLRPVSGKYFISKYSNQSVRGNDLTLVSRHITQLTGYRFRSLDDCLGDLRYILTTGKRSPILAEASAPQAV